MNRRILFFIFLFFISIFTVQSQISIRVGPLAGLTAPTVDYSGEAKDFYSGTKYGMRSGLNYGLLGKVILGPLNGRLSVSYVSLDNNGIANPNQPNSKAEITQNIFMFTVGTEISFPVPSSPVKPYGGIDVLFSSISGTYNFQGTAEVSSGEKSIKSATRTGLGFAFGSEISFGRQFTLDLSLRYNLINLFGKSYDGLTNSNDRNDAYTNLNDAADPKYSRSNTKHPIGNDRSIVTIQIIAALLFGF
ncbi:MAG: outer membrane beta-barrel protein [Ignavibacteria bacterium]|nr:outer membrane beta-barrel protein [Ignavibacteria bacterium]